MSYLEYLERNKNKSIQKLKGTKEMERDSLFKPQSQGNGQEVSRPQVDIAVTAITRLILNTLDPMTKMVMTDFDHLKDKGISHENRLQQFI